jgi:hypothetical protein
MPTSMNDEAVTSDQCISERDLIIAIVAARHDKSKVVENALAKAVHERQPVRGRKIDSRLPFFGAELQSYRRKPHLH